MADISISLVERVAALARLKIPEEEISGYLDHFEQILSYLSSIDTAHDLMGEQYRSDVIGEPCVERPDLVQTLSVTEDAISQAPQSAGSAFQVPRIVES